MHSIQFHFSFNHEGKIVPIISEQRKLDIKLLSAIKVNIRDLSEIANLLEKGANINAQDCEIRPDLQHLIEDNQDKSGGELFEYQENMTPLMWAINLHYDEKLVQFLIEEGANLDAQSYSGTTPLMWAALSNNHEASRILIKHGADIHVRNAHGETALRVAARMGAKEVCEVLIQHGAEVDTQNNWQATPLTKAAQWGFSSVCELLLNHGADIRKRTAHGFTAIRFSSLYKSKEEATTCTKKLITLSRFYPQYSNKEIQDAQKRTLTRLCILKKVCPLLPIDIKNFIFSLNADTMRDTYASPLLKMHTTSSKTGRTIKNDRIFLLTPQVIGTFIKAKVCQLEPTVTTLMAHKIAQLTPIVTEVRDEIEVPDNEDDESREDSSHDSVDEYTYYEGLNKAIRKILNPEKLELNFGEDIKKIIRSDLR